MRCRAIFCFRREKNKEKKNTLSRHCERRSAPTHCRAESIGSLPVAKPRFPREPAPNTLSVHLPRAPGRPERAHPSSFSRRGIAEPRSASPAGRRRGEAWRGSGAGALGWRSRGLRRREERLRGRAVAPPGGSCARGKRRLAAGELAGGIDA